MSTNLTELKPDLKDACSMSDRQPRQRLIKVAVFLASLSFSAAAFILFDWAYSAAAHRPHVSAGKPDDSCQVRDPVRHHVFKPNCASTEYWGEDSYKFFTNSLGFRDEKIREVPLADARPRILVLGNSFVEGKLAWHKSFVGRIAAQFPQYDFLNGGLSGYSPSTYLKTTRIMLAKGFDIDEVIVFLDNSAVQQEAAYYHDVDASGAVAAIEREQQHPATSWYVRLRRVANRNLAITADFLRLFDRFQRPLIRRGYYHLPAMEFGDPFDLEMSAWTYRKVNETDPFPAGYAPLGVEGGLAKQQAKLDLLWQELQRRNIPLSVVIYPHLGQLVHDKADNRQVQTLRQWCEGKCKRFISVLPAFFAAKKQCPPSQPGCWYMKLFVFGDIHFSAAGNALVADEVIKSLTKDPPVKLLTTAAKPKLLNNKN